MTDRIEIGLREVYDKMVEVSGDVRTLKENSTDVSAILKDHESRLRNVERVIAGAIAVATVASAVAALIFH